MSKTKTKTKYLTHLTLLPKLLKKIGLLSAANVTHLTCEGHQKMPYKFDEHDATDLSRMIRRRRPEWTHQGIMKSLQQAAEAGASLGQVTTAAEKSTQNKKALTPAAIMWAEHWTADVKAVNMTGVRLCAQCDPARKHPITDMTEVARGVWICASCAGASGSDGARV